jgi:hypothetical protein
MKFPSNIQQCISATVLQQTLLVKFQTQQMCIANTNANALKLCPLWLYGYISRLPIQPTPIPNIKDTQRFTNVERKGTLNKFVKNIKIDVRNSSSVTTVNYEEHGLRI